VVTLTDASATRTGSSVMASAQVVETSLNVSPSQDYTHLDDHTSPTYDMNPGFKPFTVNIKCITQFCCCFPNRVLCLDATLIPVRKASVKQIKR